MPMETETATDAVLDYWFGELGPQDWFSGRPELDDQIRDRFGTLCEQALSSKPEDHLDDPRAALAGIILLDQFPFREDPVAAVARSIETIELLDEACSRVDLGELADAQSRQDALAVQRIYWNALLGSDRIGSG